MYFGKRGLGFGGYSVPLYKVEHIKIFHQFLQLIMIIFFTNIRVSALFGTLSYGILFLAQVLRPICCHALITLSRNCCMNPWPEY